MYSNGEPNTKVPNYWVLLFEILLTNIGSYLDRLCDLVSPPDLPRLTAGTKEDECIANFFPDGFYLWNQDFYEMICRPLVKCDQELKTRPPTARPPKRCSMFENKSFSSNIYDYFDEIYFGIIYD